MENFYNDIAERPRQKLRIRPVSRSGRHLVYFRRCSFIPVSCFTVFLWPAPKVGQIKNIIQSFNSPWGLKLSQGIYTSGVNILPM